MVALGEKIVRGLLDISAQATVIFCVLILVRAVFSLGRMPKKYVCFLWMILFIRLLMPVQPESPLGLWTKGDMQAASVENRMGHSDQAAGANESMRGELQSTGNADGSEAQQRSGNNDVSMRMQWAENRDAPGEQQGTGMILFIAWGTGCLGCLLYGGISCLLLKRKLQCSIKRDDNCYLTDGIPTAFVMGVFSPKIYLPSELCGEDLSYVMLHERMHIQRGDHLVKMAAYIITCFYWFHPLVWTTLFFLGRDMELACDEAVLRVLGEDSRRAYADALLRLSDEKSYFAGTPVAFGKGDTENRIRHIIRYRKSVGAAAVIAAVVLSSLTVCLLTGRPEANGSQGSGSAETHSVNDSQGSEPAVAHSGESGRREAADENSLSASAAQEENRSIGENSPDSINSRFPEPVKLPSGHIVAVTGDGYHITITIDGEAYKMADLCGEVNALEDIREFGEYIVVTGHISPDTGYYGFYHTGNRLWELELTGALLTWDENWDKLENPIESVIYAESNGDQEVIRDWQTKAIAVVDLEEEYVYGLKREGDDITITIVDYGGERRELQLNLKDLSHTA